MKQKLNYSHSQIQSKKECLYAFYLKNFLSWGGWNKNAEPRTRRAYTLKNMTNMYMFVGTVVHELIEYILKEIYGGREIPTLDFIKRNAVDRLNTGWKQSKNKEWQNDPKNKLNLFEHYYDRKISQEKLQQHKEKLLVCIENFYKSKLFAELKDLRKEDIVTTEDLLELQLNTGEKSWIKIDMGFRRGDKIILIDWKTGKPNNEIKSQLLGYAMFAIKHWENKVENIEIIPAFLFTDTVFHKIDFTLDDLAAQANLIREEYKILQDLFDKKNDEAFFFENRTQNKNTCSFCVFQDMCSGALT